jgi:hypothetical protein
MKAIRLYGPRGSERAVLEEVARTVCDPAEVDGEIHALLTRIVRTEFSKRAEYAG